MVGAICKWEVLTHPVVTIQCFGWMVFFRAVFAGREQTFLSLLANSGSFSRPAAPAADSIDRCIDLERRVMRVYDALAETHADKPAVGEFFGRLARHEESHAELLEICRAAAGRGRWRTNRSTAWQALLPGTEGRLSQFEAVARGPHTIVDALRLVLQMESSQINRLFAGVIDAIDPRLATKLHAFRDAVKEHLDFLCDEISALEPILSDECRQFRTRLDRAADANAE